MKTTKRIFAVLLAMLMAFGVCAVGASADEYDSGLLLGFNIDSKRYERNEVYRECAVIFSDTLPDMYIGVDNNGDYIGEAVDPDSIEFYLRNTSSSELIGPLEKTDRGTFIMFNDQRRAINSNNRNREWEECLTATSTPSGITIEYGSIGGYGEEYIVQDFDALRYTKILYAKMCGAFLLGLISGEDIEPFCEEQYESLELMLTEQGIEDEILAETIACVAQLNALFEGDDSVYQSKKADLVAYANAYSALMKYLDENRIYLPADFPKEPSFAVEISWDEYHTLIQEYTSAALAYLANENVTIPADDPTEPAPAISFSDGGVIVEGTADTLNGATGINVTTLPSNYQAWGGPGQRRQAWNITLNPANTQPNGYVAVYVPVHQDLLTGPQGEPAPELKIYYVPQGNAQVDMNAEPVYRDGQWYMMFTANHFSEYALVAPGESGESDDGGDSADMPVLSWWQTLSGFVQWLLRWLCFGWIWMK